MRDLKYSETGSANNVINDESIAGGDSEKLYFGYDVKYKIKNDVKKEITYVPERKIRGKNTLIGGVLITQYRNERVSGFSVLKKIPNVEKPLAETLIDRVWNHSGLIPSSPGRPASLVAWIWRTILENIITFRSFQFRECLMGLASRSSDLKKGKNGFAVYIDIMMSKKQANRMISYMREGNFIDSLTKSIVVNIAAYNPVTLRFTNTACVH